MKKILAASCLAVFACTMMCLSNTPPVWAQTAPVDSQITVKIDKTRYNTGDIMIVSGSVKNVVSQIPLTLQILDPTNNLVHVEQILVTADGRFSLPLKIEGPLWRLPGQYTLIAQYGFKHVSATVQFDFEQKDIPVEGVFNVKDMSSGQNFDLNYTITGGTVKSIVIDPQDISLVVHLDAQYPGMLHLEIPRLLLDAKKTGNADESFLIFVDDDEVTSFQEEASDSQYRILDIPLVSGDSKIEIIGTQVVPEFGNISGMMFVLSVLLAIFLVPKIKTYQIHI
ncbi:conserved exported hypothetical protein [Nitrosotalea sinensis]|jgi:hypothetical protein|uniref:PEFG-CTERM sorting domain-containing protein n=1 Tax=Nitrosotalea sinensis TaxID=1499975 RepID=A0A2H1EGZ2_9ARCH|nr:hypothetical protein [Candidatus Nitrosotalea sinensis]SHO45480.1 conserved exported hypothetical protein [Candidatus Nitrosotalea sinensis]